MSNFNFNLLSAVQTPTNLSNSLSSMIPGSFYTCTSIVSAVNFSRNTTLSAIYTTNISVGNNITDTTYNTITAATLTLSSFSNGAGFTGVSAVSTFFTAKQSNVPHVVINSIGTINGKTVVGLAFNKLPDDVTLTTTPLCAVTTLSAFNGNTFRVNAAYNLTEMAFILSDRSTSQFTCITARDGTSQQQLSANNFNGSYPEQRRLWNLNG